MVRKRNRRFLAALTALVLVVLLLFPSVSGASPDPRCRDFGDPGGFMNILPPGQDGVVNGAEMLRYQLTKKYPKHYSDQTDMYNSLVYAAPGLSDKDLPKYFKDASFGVKGKIERFYSPTKGATILRDKYPDDWKYDSSRDSIKQTPVGLIAAPDMQWMNRPTFQQVVQVGVD